MKLNTTSGTTLGPIGKAFLDLNIDEQNFTHNFIVCTKLKQKSILGLSFAQRYKIGIDLDINEKLFLRHEGQKIATSLKTNDYGQWTIALLKISTNGKNEIDSKICLITTTTVQIPPQDISLVPLKVINQSIKYKISIRNNTIIEEHPLLMLKLPKLVLLPTLQRLGS